MKKLISTLISGVAVAATLALPASAHAEDYPLSGAISTGVTANHAALRPIEFADPGFTRASLSASVFYSPAKKLLLIGGLSVLKTLDAGQEGQGTIGETGPGRTQLQDLSLSANYTVGSLGPVSITTGLGITVPLSETSKAAGLVTAISPQVVAQLPLGKVILQLAGGLTYFVNDNPTQRIDCTDAQFRVNCEVSGRDLGNPNSLLSYGTSFGVIYLPIKGMVLSTSYGISAGIGAVEFPEDEFTPPGVQAQNDAQFNAATHGMRFGISYSLAGLTASADGAEAEEIDPNIDPSLQVAGGEDAPFWSRFTLSLGMSTRDTVYARDRSDGVRITVPVYDFETNTGQRTTYTFGISYNI